MTIKDLVMPINYFNLNDASFAINSAIFSLAGLILVVSIIYEYLNERDILGPLKRFIVAIILITIALPVQNFVVEKSFAAGDVLMNSLSDPDKLEMINDPSAFMDKLSEMQFSDNTKEVTEVEEIGDTGVKGMVTSSKINFAGVIFDQLKNIPNILIATITFGFISWCLYSLQASYYILYFISGAMFVIPAILSIFPPFETSLAGAFKSLGTLFVMPIFVALIAAMLSIKMAEFGANQTSAGTTIHNVAIVASLCFALGSSIFISAGFLVASGISQNLGAAGTMATAAVMSGAVKVGSSVLMNRGAIAHGARAIGNTFKSTGIGGVNTAVNSLSLLKGGANRAATKDGVYGAAARPVAKMLNKMSELKSNLSAKKEEAKSAFNHHKSSASPFGRAGGILKSMHLPSEKFKKVNSDIESIKKSGFKSNLRPTGTIEPKNLMQLRSGSPEAGVSSNPGNGINFLNKSHLLYNNKGAFKSASSTKPRFNRLGSFSPKSKSSFGSSHKFRSSQNNGHKNNNYKLNNWEKEFLKRTSQKKSLTPQESLIKSNIHDVERYGRKHWENKFVENVSTMENPTSRQLNVRDSILSKRG